MVNGKLTDLLPATDRGLHYGDGLFETIAVVAGRPRLWDEHMARLDKGCKVLNFPALDPAVLLSEANMLCGESDRAVLKIVLTRGSGGRGYAMPDEPEISRCLFRYPWPDYSALESGVHLRRCTAQLACNPSLAGIKHLNRLEQVLARAEWSDPAIHEGVMCNLSGMVVEGTMSNLFWVKDKMLYTPDLSHCGVAGVMRAEVLKLAEKIGVDVSTGSITPDELMTMDEIFITNSLMSVRHVRKYEGREFACGDITLRLQQAMEQKLGA